MHYETSFASSCIYTVIESLSVRTETIAMFAYKACSRVIKNNPHSLVLGRVNNPVNGSLKRFVLLH